MELGVQASQFELWQFAIQNPSVEIVSQIMYKTDTGFVNSLAGLTDNTQTPDVDLSEAFEQTKRFDIEHLPVVASSEDNKFIGILNCRAVRRSLSAEVLARQQKPQPAGGYSA